MRIGISAAEPGGDQALSKLADQLRRPTTGSRRCGWRTSSGSTRSTRSRWSGARSRHRARHRRRADLPAPSGRDRAAGAHHQAASRGRFVLGIGLSHKIVIENMFGLSYDKPAKHMREYLKVLGPLLRGEGGQFQGEQYSAQRSCRCPAPRACRCCVAALGPAMLQLAGELADGTITWMTGPKTLAQHIVPTLARRPAGGAAGAARRGGLPRAPHEQARRGARRRSARRS